MSQTHDEIRALRVMVEELRDEPPPDLPWDAIEARLLSRLAVQPVQTCAPSTAPWGQGAPRARRSSSVSSASPLLRVFGFAAAAAVLALGAGRLAGSGEMPVASAPQRHAIDAAAVALTPGSARVHDLSALHAGDVVEAGEAPLRFGQAGLATWTLAPGSVAVVHTTGLGHTVTLERGAIRAEVTPRDPSEGLVEAFAVEVGGTRVAVHGTAFSVKVEGAQVIVDVEHGAVAVGPVGNAGATTGHLLVGPSRATFSLDGGRSARLLDRTSGALVANDADDVGAEPTAAVAARGPLAVPAPLAEPEARGDRTAAAPAPKPLAARAPADDKVAARPAPPPPAAVEPPAEPPRLSVAAVQGRLNRCFRLTYESSPAPGSVLSVASTLRVDVNADGTWKARFDPPLKPEMQQCAGSAISGRFPDGAGHLDIPVSFQP